MYGSVQAAFQHGITAPFRSHRRDSPPPAVDQQPPLQRIRDHDHVAGGEPPQDGARDGRALRNRVRQRRPNRAREVVETLGNADRAYSEDKADAEGGPEAEEVENLSASGSDSQSETDSDNQQETQEDQAVGGDAAAVPQATPKPCQSSQAKAKPLKENKNLPEDKLSRKGAASRSRKHQGQFEIPAGNQPPQTSPASEVQVSFFHPSKVDHLNLKRSHLTVVISTF